MIKNKVPFDQFQNLLNKKEGGKDKLVIELLQQINSKIKPHLITKDQITDIISDFDKKLDDIRQSIKFVIG